MTTPADAIEAFLGGMAIAVLLYPLLQWRVRQLERNRYQRR